MVTGRSSFVVGRAAAGRLRRAGQAARARLRQGAQARIRPGADASGRNGRYVGEMAGVAERARPATSRETRRLSWSGAGITRKDLSLAAVVLVLQLGLPAVAEGHHGPPARLNVAEWLLLLVGPAALLTWRRHPVVVL